MSSGPNARADQSEEPSRMKEESLQMKEIKKLLSKAVFHLDKTGALEKMTGTNDVHFLIQYLKTLSSQPDFHRHARAVLIKLYSNPKLSPTCDILDNIEGLSQKDGGGYCDIFRGSYQRQDLCFKVARAYQRESQDQLLKAHAIDTIFWSQLENPNIVPTYGFFRLKQMSDRIGLVSPWMANDRLSVSTIWSLPITYGKAVKLHDIVSGLKYLHDNDIVHGNFKGANVLINEFSTACLADFGVSEMITDGALSFKPNDTAHGTTRRVSPELMEEGARPTLASDIWAFSCVCFEILTGSLPFAGCKSDHRVGSKTPAQSAMHRLDPDGATNEEIWKLTGKCWTIDAARRPTSTQLLRMMEGNPILWQITIEKSQRSANHDRQFPYTTASNDLLDHDRAKQCLKRIFSDTTIHSYFSDSTATDAGLVSRLERVHFYTSLSYDLPKLLHRSDLLTRPFIIPRGRFPVIPEKTAHGVYDQVLNPIWRSTVCPEIVALLRDVKRGIHVSSFLPVRFSTHDDDGRPVFGPIVIWISVHPNTTAATACRDANSDILALLESHGVMGAAVHWIEGTVERVVGPPMMRVVNETHPTAYIRRALTAVLGVPLAAEEMADATPRAPLASTSMRARGATRATES